MKLILISILLLSAGCTSSNEYGPCVGIGADRDPKLSYRLSAWNIAMGVIFVEFLVPPIMVAAEQAYCPVGLKAEAK